MSTLQAKDITLSDPAITFQLLSAAGASAPAEWREDNAAVKPGNLKYAQLEGKRSGQYGRRARLLFISPSVDADEKRIGQTSIMIDIRHDGTKSLNDVAEDVKTFFAFCSEETISEALKRGIAPF